ncbi:hypothetical protein [Martelella mangrovi]|uniref:DUF2833 domain-containing protein n=1 Tax=Martelella mangrovi TaxID=1397477 RepID=A0ABV2IDY3_9HYPH
MAEELRPEDKEEARAGGASPLQALVSGFALSDQCFTIEADEGPIAIFGHVRLPDGEGSPWLLGTEGIERHWLWFLRNSPEIIARVQRPYRRIYNFVDARNAVHIKWLRWCGFSFAEQPLKLGPETRPFYYFWKETP